MQPRSAETLTVRQLLTIALDWIEAQATMNQGMVAVSLQGQLAECEPACRAACLPAPPEQAIELLGPAGTYPLAIGLTLLSAVSGKPWGFVAQPWTWTDEDWQQVTDAVAELHCRPISYRTGFQRVSIAPQLAT